MKKLWSGLVQTMVLFSSKAIQKAEENLPPAVFRF